MNPATTSEIAAAIGDLGTDVPPWAWLLLALYGIVRQALQVTPRIITALKGRMTVVDGCRTNCDSAMDHVRKRTGRRCHRLDAKRTFIR